MSSEPQSNSKSGMVNRRWSIPHLLEHGDGWAHVLVATLLLLLAIGILFTSTFHFVKDVMNPGENTFSQLGLAYLSELLFGVIILELLSTILTYIHARNLEATIKDFLIVGLISSVRKILLTGAQSSIESVDKKTGENAALIHDKAMGFAYINEAIGTVITIIGILLLIGGLLLLDRRKKLVPSSEAAE